MPLPNLSAAVLIGGASRRMGEPKALVRLTESGPTMLEIVASKAARVAEGVFLVGEAGWPVPHPIARLRRVSDPGVCAADGVVAALRASTHPLCLVLACDMPLIDVALLREMAHLAHREGTGVIAVGAGGAHPLHAVWRRDSVGAIEERVAAGERELGVLARAAGLLPLSVDDPDRPDAWRWSVFNVNTPDDLIAARRRMQRDPEVERLYCP